jgi:UDP-N-acetylglucosamine 2-epimerase (non-hydrolysing)
MAKTIHLICAARPNFMKIAPVYHALKACGWARPVLIHTGQHYDANMSDAIFADLGLPAPDHHLGVGSGGHGETTGRVMIAYERIALAETPDWIVVVGDVNPTAACSMVGAKLHIPVAHLEAGLRSRDRTMPEEINRLVTDAIADALWTPSPDADANLRAEGVAAERISRVGNIMLDSFELMRPKIDADPLRRELGLDGTAYGVVTLHRPSNVDQEATLTRLVDCLTRVARRLTLVFPVHPRTRARLEQFGLWQRLAGDGAIRLTEPVSYVPFMRLVTGARLVITDSGGLQEETTYLGLPCLTVRPNTERPITLSEGTNKLVAPDDLEAAAAQALSGDWPTGRRPALWDGRTAERVVDDLARRLYGHTG